MVVEKFVSGFWVLVLLELVTPGFLGFALFGQRFAFVAFKQTCTLIDLRLNGSQVSLDDPKQELKSIPIAFF